MARRPCGVAPANVDGVTSSPTGTLFYQIQRADSSPMAYGGSVFDFYNRDDRPEWARVRDELEDFWYSHYPGCDGELRKRFRKRGHDQHLPAARLRDRGAPHAAQLRHQARPDFLVTRNSEGAYVECKAVLERTRSTNEAAILNCTNKASHPDFILELDIDQEGTRQPSVAHIRTPIEKWLRRLNADDVIADRDAGKPLPTLPLEIDDWQLLYTAHPVPPEQRGKYSRLLGLHSSRVVMYDNVGLIKRAVRDKGRKYTDVDTPRIRCKSACGGSGFGE